MLVQLTESKRWDVTYGFGFETQLSTPQPNCRAQASLGDGRTGNNCGASGRAGASFRVSGGCHKNQSVRHRQVDYAAHHLRPAGTHRHAFVECSASWRQSQPDWCAQLSGGYSNVQNISTFPVQHAAGCLPVSHRRCPRPTRLFTTWSSPPRVGSTRTACRLRLTSSPCCHSLCRWAVPALPGFHDTRNPSPAGCHQGHVSVVSRNSYPARSLVLTLASTASTQALPRTTPLATQSIATPLHGIPVSALSMLQVRTQTPASPAAQAHCSTRTPPAIRYRCRNASMRVAQTRTAALGSTPQGHATSRLDTRWAARRSSSTPLNYACLHRFCPSSATVFPSFYSTTWATSFFTLQISARPSHASTSRTSTPAARSQASPLWATATSPTSRMLSALVLATIPPSARFALTLATT